MIFQKIVSEYTSDAKYWYELKYFNFFHALINVSLYPEF